MLKYTLKLYGKLPLRLRVAFRKLWIACGLTKAIIKSQIALTYRCNARCNKCSISLYKKEQLELSTEEAKLIIDQLCEIGTAQLGFFGGEPLLRKDIFELVSYASGKGVKTEIFTNGYLLSKSTVHKLKEAGLGRAEISIDSSKAKLHDKLRQLPGCFANAVKGIKYCVEEGIPVIINTVATKENLHNGDVEEIIRLGKALGARRVKIIPPTMIGCWVNGRRKLLEDCDYERILCLTESDKFVVSEIRKVKGRIHRSCLCRMHSRVYISPYGDVQPCWAVPVSFGNVRENSLGDIVKSMKKNLKVSRYDCVSNDDEFRKVYFDKPRAELPIRSF